MSRKKKQRSRDDEPNLDLDEWIEWGGEFMMPVGFTEGGAPYGVTLAEHRAYTEEDARDRRANWIRAKDTIRGAFATLLPNETPPDVGRVQRMGRGVRRPFQLTDGLSRLWDASMSSGGAAISSSEIHLHELGLAAEWYRDASSERSPDQRRRQALNAMRGILRRAEAANDGK